MSVGSEFHRSDAATGKERRTEQLITLIFFTNWCYTKMARREIIFAHRT